MTAVATHSGAGAAADPGTPPPMPRGRRSTELLMLVFAVGVVLAAYASAGLGLSGKLPAAWSSTARRSPCSCSPPISPSGGWRPGRTR